MTNQLKSMELDVKDRAQIWGSLRTYSTILSEYAAITLCEIILLSAEKGEGTEGHYWGTVDISEIRHALRFTGIENVALGGAMVELLELSLIVMPDPDNTRQFLPFVMSWEWVYDEWIKHRKPKRNTGRYKRFVKAYQARLEDTLGPRYEPEVDA